MRFTQVLIFAVVLYSVTPAHAAYPRTFSMGLNALSHGMSRIANRPTGSVGALGTTYFNFDFQLHVPVANEVLWSPRIIMMPDSLMAVKASGSEVKTSFLILGLPLTFDHGQHWDWSFGPALVSYQIKGPGGTATLNNGNGTSAFAIPGRSETTNTVGLILGGSYNAGRFRTSLETLTEGLASNSKRTYSLMLTFSYALYQF